MALSNSTDFMLNVSDLITEARRKAGVHADEEPLAATDLESDMRTLNLMLKSWQADGVMAWTLEDDSLTMVDGQASYAFGSGGDFTTIPFDIIAARINRTNDIPMERLSRREYFDLPNKDTKGFPTQYYYHRQRSGGTLYVWPVPDVAAGTFKFTYRRIIMDLDTQADDFDVPSEWFDAVVYGLADRILENYGMSSSPEGKKITARAMVAYENVKEFDVQDGESIMTMLPEDH